MRDISLIFHLQKSSTVLFTLLLRAFLSLNTWYSSLERGNSPSPFTGYFSANSWVSGSPPCSLWFYLCRPWHSANYSSWPKSSVCGSQQGHSTLPLSQAKGWTQNMCCSCSLLHKLCFLPPHCSAELEVQLLFNESIWQKNKLSVISLGL